MNLAYADPPYLGCCNKYGHEHNDTGTRPFDGRCWDDPDTHVALLNYLATDYDGWAYSCTSKTPIVLGAYANLLLPGFFERCRTAAWIKSFAAFKPNVRVAYAWEPVLFQQARESSKTGATPCRDFIVEPITMRRGFTGTKPERVCRWVLDLLGYVEGDEVDDLFPGTNPMARAMAEGVLL